jgi:hypothetical protein
MYPEDRVLVTLVADPQDFSLIRDEHWYRIPYSRAPKGVHAEYLAFYFGRRFGTEKWAIHYYARNHGHELVRRRELLPHQLEHPRADRLYHKVQLGPLIKREKPIISVRWRRVTFIHTTWDRFVDASEINDLFVDGGPYVDRLYAILKDRGIQAERAYRVNEAGAIYVLPLVIPCRHGRLGLRTSEIPGNDKELSELVETLVWQIQQRGGVAR